jgi:hypothetical protein
VTVLVMNVREMCMAVAQRSVLMLMGMRLNAIPSLRMFVLMMRIVHVSMGMLKRLMRVHVRVLLPNVQVYADCHQRSGHPGHAAHRLPVNEDRERGADEGGGRKVSAGSCSAKVPQCYDEEHQTYAIAHETQCKRPRQVR